MYGEYCNLVTTDYSKVYYYVYPNSNTFIEDNSEEWDFLTSGGVRINGKGLNFIIVNS